MDRLSKSLGHHTVVPSVALVAVVLTAVWMGNINGGYFVSEWGLVALGLAALALTISTTGEFRGMESWRSIAALGLFATYAAWTFASLLWSPNQGDAWLGAGQTLLYVLTFWVALTLVASGASRRWVLAASAIGPAIVAAFTLLVLVPRFEILFSYDEATLTYERLMGTV